MSADKSDFFGYNRRLQPFANRLRKEMTKAEACLWKYALRARQMKGYQFRRQRPVLNYIADFMCMDLKLIIELDGLTHSWEETVIKDEKKQQTLEEAGFTVIRFPNRDVLQRILYVKETIANIIEELEKKKA